MYWGDMAETYCRADGPVFMSWESALERYNSKSVTVPKILVSECAVATETYNFGQDIIQKCKNLAIEDGFLDDDEPKILQIIPNT